MRGTVSEDMGGMVLEDSSDIGMMASWNSRATVAFLGAGRELISRWLDRPLIADNCNSKSGHCKN
jgi:hypothetical protein